MECPSPTSLDKDHQVYYTLTITPFTIANLVSGSHLQPCPGGRELCLPWGYSRADCSSGPGAPAVVLGPEELSALLWGLRCQGLPAGLFPYNKPLALMTKWLGFPGVH